jgi:Ca2+-transporting ATPase
MRDDTGAATDRLRLDTIIFHSFILMNLFNQINCRVVDANELNVFTTLFNNPTFWVIMAFEFGVQQLMINAGHSTLGSALLGTAPLTQGMVATCWGFGIFSLVVNVALKKIPLENFAFVRHIDLETDNKDEFINKYMAKTQDSYNKSVNNVLK